MAGAFAFDDGLSRLFAVTGMRPRDVPAAYQIAAAAVLDSRGSGKDLLLWLGVRRPDPSITVRRLVEHLAPVALPLLRSLREYDNAAGWRVPEELDVSRDPSLVRIPIERVQARWSALRPWPADLPGLTWTDVIALLSVKVSQVLENAYRPPETDSDGNLEERFELAKEPWPTQQFKAVCWLLAIIAYQKPASPPLNGFFHTHKDHYSVRQRAARTIAILTLLASYSDTSPKISSVLHTSPSFSGWTKHQYSVRSNGTPASHPDRQTYWDRYFGRRLTWEMGEFKCDHCNQDLPGMNATIPPSFEYTYLENKVTRLIQRSEVIDLNAARGIGLIRSDSPTSPLLGAERLQRLEANLDEP